LLARAEKGGSIACKVYDTGASGTNWGHLNSSETLPLAPPLGVLLGYWQWDGEPIR